MTTTAQSQTNLLEYDSPTERTHPLSLTEQCANLGTNVIITAEFEYYPINNPIVPINFSLDRKY